MNVFYFSLSPTSSYQKKYDACYEWRKISMKSELWSQLPFEMIEEIAYHCIIYTIIEHQPSGMTNMSRIHDSFFLDIYSKDQHPVPGRTENNIFACPQNNGQRVLGGVGGGYM